MSEEQRNQKSPEGEGSHESPIQSLQNWYARQTNGDWEHGRGITIKTIDNPGWMLDIDLNGIEHQIPAQPYILHEISVHDWYTISIENNYFRAAGDPNKLEVLIKAFLALIEKQE